MNTQAKLIEVITSLKGNDIVADFEIANGILEGDMKLITSALVAFYKAGEIADVTKDLARSRTTKFDPQFRADVISGALNDVTKVEAYIKASDSATSNTLKKKAYFEKELKLSLDARANERSKVYAELGLDSSGKVKPKARK